MSKFVKDMKEAAAESPRLLFAPIVGMVKEVRKVMKEMDGKQHPKPTFHMQSREEYLAKRKERQAHC